MNLKELLHSSYGYTSFRPGQEEIIEQVLKGKDVIALLPTGMGKSMCYQLPARLLKGSVLIVSPLLSLMQDQVAQLKKMGEKSVVAINSFTSPQEKAEIWRSLHNFRFIFVSPEMLMQPFVKKQLQKLDISLVVADEAHCISQWGFDFRPDYLRIAEILPLLGNPQILALTATATAKVTEEIKSYLEIDEPFLYIHPMDRENIVYDRKKFEDPRDKTSWLLEFVGKFQGPGIIYAGTRKKSEELSSLLMDQGISSSHYHGGMEHQDRIFVQQQFQNGELEWVCSTNAFGMGVHISNIRHVIHFHLPTSVEGYVQEVGRAGRDGEPALATLLHSPGDEGLMASMVLDDLPTRHEIEEVYRQGDAVDQLVNSGIVRETAYRVLSYWRTRLPVEGTIAQINMLQQQKILQIEKMNRLVTTEGCIRKFIIECFDQELFDLPENCCINHGIIYQGFHLRTQSATSALKQSWQDRLNALMPL